MKNTFKRIFPPLAALLCVLVALVATSGRGGHGGVRQGRLETSRYVYEGGVNKGKQHGYGVCRYKNGDTYYGFWDMGYKDGLGRMVYAGGKKIEFGSWRKGKYRRPKGQKFEVGERVYGIDVAKYQNKVDWQRLSFSSDSHGRVSGRSDAGNYRQPVLFALMKSTEGSTIVDPTFKRNFKAAKECGIVRGAYHFLSVNSSVESQVRNFIRHTPLAKGDFPPVLDLEISRKTMQTQHKKVCRMALEWLRAVERHYGVKPIVYTYDNYYKEYLKGRGFDDYDFWVARFAASEPKERHWEIWQFTENGRCKGINHKVDIDLFRGDYRDLQ